MGKGAVTLRLRQIEVFHAVYSCGSVTRAAEVLNVSQPSVSKVLAHAEQQLGYALFDRVKGKFIPTPEANQLFAQVTQVNDSVDRLRQLAANLRSMEKGTIRIAATPAFGIDFLPGAIAGSNHLAKALVSHGVGVAIADEVTARSGGHDKLVIRQLEPALNFRISALHIDQEPMSLVCRDFVDHLKSSLQQFLHDETGDTF